MAYTGIVATLLPGKTVHKIFIRYFIRYFIFFLYFTNTQSFLYQGIDIFIFKLKITASCNTFRTFKDTIYLYCRNIEISSSVLKTYELCKLIRMMDA